MASQGCSLRRKGGLVRSCLWGNEEEEEEEDGSRLTPMLWAKVSKPCRKSKSLSGSLNSSLCS